MREELLHINFQQLEIFFCAVETESFTKAAARLHMTQSAVSKSIAKLEEELDLQLFTRRHRELYVTQAGRELRRLWKEQAEQFSASYETVFALQHAADSRLKIGATNTTDFSTYFWPILNAFMQKYPECRPELESDNMDRLIDKLANGKLDLIFVPDFMKYKIDDLGLCRKWAAKDQVQILLPSNHPLADQDLTLSLLKDEKIILLDEGDYPENARFVSELFSLEGYEIRVADHHYRTPEGINDFYRPADGILFTDSFFKFDTKRRDLIRKPLSGYENGIICGWNKDNPSRCLHNLLQSLPLKKD